MKFRIFASFVGMSDNIGNGWSDYEVMVYSNSKKNAIKKLWSWAKKRGATQRQIQFVDKEMWRNDHCYHRYYIK